MSETKQMKTLTIGRTTYEIVDDAAREDISSLSLQIEDLSTGGVVVSSVEPAIDDIPKVFFEGVL